MKGIASKLVMAVVCCGLLLSSAGCGDSKTANQKDKVTIKVLTSKRDDMDVRQAQVDRFNSENDRIFIDYEIKSDNINDVLKVAYTSNTSPDIHTPMDASYTIGAIKNGWLRELDSSFVEECKEAFIAECVEPSPVDGKYYNIAVGGASGSKFLWNKDLFRECGLDPENPPKTWDEVREYAKIITEKSNGAKYGYVIPLKDAIFTRYYVMIPGSPSGLYNCDGFEPTTGKFDFSIYGQMVNYLRDLIADGSIFPTPNTIDNDTARAQFAEGNIGMISAMGWDVGVFNDQFPAKCDWGITDYPVFDEVKGGYPYLMGGGDAYTMSAQSKHPEEQLEVLKWLISEENLKELQMAGKGNYGLKSIMKPEFMNEEKKGNKEFSTPTYPIHIIDKPSNNPLGVLTLEGQNQYDVLKNLVVTENIDVEKELQELTDRYNAALDKYLQDEGKSRDEFITADWSFAVEQE